MIRSPKPPATIPRSKPERLPERRAVTIIAGFKSYEGVVLCADTQETIGSSKRNVPKLIFQPEHYYLPSTIQHHVSNPGYLAAAFCGAGHGPFIDKLVERTWQDMQSAKSLDDACSIAEASIGNTYDHFGRIYQVGHCPEVELIFGVKMENDSRLFTAIGPVVNEKKTCDSSGIGSYLANFISARMYREHLTLHQCVILAAYTLFQTKEHVDGCGGESHIAVLRNEGISGRVDLTRIESITKLLQHADTEAGSLILETGNLGRGEKEYTEAMYLIVEVLNSLRDATQKEIKQAAETWGVIGRALGGPTYRDQPKDEFGLPMPSAPETSEDQQ